MNSFKDEAEMKSIAEKWADIRFFVPKEFDSPDFPNSGLFMNLEFIRILDAMRRDCGFPFQITSGYRTPEHNAKEGGVPGSSHELGIGVDIACGDSHKRFLMVRSAFTNGLKRIIPYARHIHVDMDFTKPQEVMPIGEYKQEG